jgi:hypothetical protein
MIRKHAARLDTTGPAAKSADPEARVAPSTSSSQELHQRKILGHQWKQRQGVLTHRTRCFGGLASVTWTATYTAKRECEEPDLV